MSVLAWVHVGIYLRRERLACVPFSYYLLTECCRHMDYKLLKVIYHCGAFHF